MNKTFSSFEDLLAAVESDKAVSGASAITANRYPIRFVLFDNFRDSFEFVQKMQSDHRCKVESVGYWMEADFNDTIITHTKLADSIKEFVHQHSTKDWVLTPFSELARFYDNQTNFEFNALVSTIKGIEASAEAIKNQQRIYIPIVGLEGKMSKFDHDSQIVIWYYKNTDNPLNYKLILTDNTTYDVNGLAEQLTVVRNMQQWLKIWQDKNAKPQIVSTSPSLFANAEFAQPDNAFSFCKCSNVYDFLTKGLELNFGSIPYKEQDENYWLQLAKAIDVQSFSLEKFFNQHFHIDDLADYRVFLKTWFDCHSSFEKWLLTNYYSDKFCQKGYICQAINAGTSFADNDFFAVIALAIFDLENAEDYLEERNICLYQAAKKSVVLSAESQNELVEKLEKLAVQKGYSTAIRYFSPLTNAEKALALTWLGDGKISKEDCKAFFPDVYNYLGKSYGTKENWVLDYIDQYKQCKIANTYSDILQSIIEEKNASATAFNSWYQNFKTTETVLFNRNDIEVYYWIDGLGIDWIPFIAESLRSKENLYLNEVYIARALFPSITEMNKPALLSLSNNALKKIGDLDTHAHKQGNKYPNSVIEEMEIVRTAIEQIIHEYAGKKIAIVSDHGLTALSQLKSGLNLAGVESDHNGRIAQKAHGKIVADDHYIICEDGKTMCALRHESLCGKIPAGQLAHGGCTPEEILVPILVISSQTNATNYSVTLLTKEIVGTEPIVKYTIKGLSNSDIPYLMYNNKRYELSHESGDIYQSERLDLVEGETSVTLYINTFELPSQIKINLGAEEEDLFNF